MVNKGHLACLGTCGEGLVVLLYPCILRRMNGVVVKDDGFGGSLFTSCEQTKAVCKCVAGQGITRWSPAQSRKESTFPRS